ncbi:DNA polymerase IV [Brachybacterium sp. EF45031]|nr:DNA polymerase IV [Brachybacterium sillae]
MATILHVDMDAFFASVEIRDDPSLVGLPVVVGGAGPRGVVAAASYPARARGIHSAMPMATARRLAPDLVIVPPRGAHYRAVSREVMEVLHTVTPEVDQVSIDEAFLDVRGARRLLGEPAHIAELLRGRIRQQVGLPSSVGVGASRAVAKIASARAKPDGLLVVPVEDTARFLAPLPVGTISGVGPRAVTELGRLGVRTVGDLLAVPPSALRRAVGPQAEALRRLAAGEDRTGLETRRVRDRSLGTERTFDIDLTDPLEIRARLTAMADEVARSLRRHDMLTRTVSIKLRRHDSRTITRSVTLDQPTASSERLREHVIALWERSREEVPRVRLAGVRAENLRRRDEGAEPLELTGRTTGWSDLEAAWDRIGDRFGQGSVHRGSQIRPAGPARPIDAGGPADSTRFSDPRGDRAVPRAQDGGLS